MIRTARKGDKGSAYKTWRCSKHTELLGHNFFLKPSKEKVLNWWCMSVLTCLLYVSSWLRAALAFLSSSSRLTVFCMYIVFFSSKSFTCRRKSPRSSNFFLYDSTWLSNLATLSEECLQGQICINIVLWKLTKWNALMLSQCSALMQTTSWDILARTRSLSYSPLLLTFSLSNCLLPSITITQTKELLKVNCKMLPLFPIQPSYLFPN